MKMFRPKVIIIIIAAIVFLTSFFLFFPRIVIGSIGKMYENESIEVFGGKTVTEGLNIEFLKNFPNITISIDNQVSYNGKNEEILALKGVYIELNPFSIFKKRYELVDCQIESANLNITRSEDGRFNSIINARAILTRDNLGVESLNNENSIDENINENNKSNESLELENVHNKSTESKFVENESLENKEKDSNKNTFNIATTNRNNNTTSPDNKFNIASKVFIKNLKINNGNIYYRSLINKYIASLNNIQITSKGKIHGNILTMNVDTNIDNITYKFHDNELYKFQLKITSLLDIDSRANKFIISHAKVDTGNIKLKGNGSFLLLKDGISVNAIINDEDVKLDSLFAFIPKSFLPNREKFSSNSKIKIDGRFNGFLSNMETPDFKINFSVEDGNILFKNKEFFKDIAFDVSIENSGEKLFDTIFEVSHLEFESPNSFFKSKARFVPILTNNNEKDYEFELSLRAKLDLGQFKQIFVNDPFRVFGIIDTNQDITGRISDFENNNFKNIRNNGYLYLSNTRFKLPSFPRIDVKKATMFIFPDFINLSKAEVDIAGSRYGVEGKFKDYIRTFKTGEVFSELNVFSKDLDLSRLVNEMKRERRAYLSSKEYRVNLDKKDSNNLKDNKNFIPFASNVVINASVRNLKVNRIKMENIVSKITVNNGDVKVNRLSKGYIKSFY